MKYSEIKALSTDELVKKSRMASGEMFTLKMRNSLGQLADPSEIRRLRRQIAWYKTAISQSLAKK